MLRGILAGCLVAMAFLGSCVALLGPAARIADPMTLRSMEIGVDRPFPVVSVNGDRPVLRKLSAPFATPAIEPGESFLVPENLRSGIEDALNEQQRSAEGEWTLNVRELAPGSQRVELYWDGDGYDGGVYDATATTITPVSRKITGPGFAFVFGAIALGLNVVLWIFVGGLVLLVRRRRAPERERVSGADSPA